MLQEFLRLPALDVEDAMTAAADRVRELLACEKVDTFVIDENKRSLVALGTSPTPLGALQKKLGLDFVSLANGGRAVAVFQTGTPFLTGRADQDPDELPGVVRDLGVRSVVNVPLEVNGVRRGVLSAVSTKPEFFDANDLQFLELISQWVGVVVHRAELVEEVRRTESNHARRVLADELVTVLAHDLRNHIQPLLGRLHLLKLKVNQGRPIDGSDLERALLSAERLSRLTSDLLDVARLDQGLFALNPRTVDLASLAREVGAALAVPGTPIHVSAPNGVTIVGDQDRLRQALENVIANAVKHSPSGRSVEVTVAETGDSATVEVADHGLGIPTDVLPIIFERYVSGSGSSGVGLGLYLASQIAIAHSGSLSVESSPGKGARFRFSFPRG
jgi:two-component system OmpR family sensor kinase